MDYPLTQPNLDLYLGKFTDGVPGVRPASVIPSITQNAIVDEIIAVIVAGGLVQSEATLTQLRDAILAMIAINGESFSAVRSINVTLALTATDLGKLSKVVATGTTITLPPIAQAAPGKVISVIAAFASGITTLKGTGAELLNNPFGTAANTFTMNAGEAIQFVSNGASWDCLGYETALARHNITVGSRVANTNYTNTTGKVMSVFAKFSHASAAFHANLFVTASGGGPEAGDYVPAVNAPYGSRPSLIVLPGEVYGWTYNNGLAVPSLITWLETY